MTPNPREQAGSLNAQASGHDLPLEATELRSSDSLQDDTTLPSAPAVTPSAYKTFQNLLQPVKKFWERQISVVVAHEGSRDHLGMNRFLEPIVFVRLFLTNRLAALLSET